MAIDQRTRRALREADVAESTLRDAERAAADAASEDAAAVVSFFGVEPGDGETATVYSDMDLAHSSDDFPAHEVAYVDLFTHGTDVRGYLRFDSWGVAVTGARPLGEDAVELTLGPTVDDRVRFARDREALR